jgi:hypothetical protein
MGEAIWKVLLASLVLGAGLPAVFALGIRSLAWGAGGDAEVSNAAPNPWGRVAAYVCFAIVLYGLIVGIVFVVATGHGQNIDLSHGWPDVVSAS